MRAYPRLTEGQRNQLYALKKAGFTQSAISAQIGVHKSTISRELKRNTGLRGYRPKQAHRLACSRVQRQQPWPVATTNLSGGSDWRTGMPVWRSGLPDKYQYLG